MNSTEMPHCEACGKKIGPSAPICPACGEPVIGRSIATVSTPKRAKNLESDLTGLGVCFSIIGILMTLVSFFLSDSTYGTVNISDCFNRLLVGIAGGSCMGFGGLMCVAAQLSLIRQSLIPSVDPPPVPQSPSGVSGVARDTV